MTCGEHTEILAVYRPTYASDGQGGRTRTWTKRGSVYAWVKLQTGKEQSTGQVLGQVQSATLTVPAYSNVQPGDRVTIGGVEFGVDAQDPRTRGPRRKLYAGRVEHNEI